MEVLRPLRHWTLWMSKTHTVTSHHVITVCNAISDHLDSVMGAVPKKKTPWKEDLYFAVKLVGQKLDKYYAELTPMTSMLLISAHILDPFRKLQSFRQWDKGMDFNPEDDTSYTTQCQEEYLKYVENEYCAKHRFVTVIKSESVLSNNLFPSATTAGFGQSSFDPYDSSRDDEECLTPNTVAETTPGRSDCAACLLTSSRPYLNSPPESPNNSGQVNPNLNDFQYDPMEISSTFWFPDITNC